MRMTKRRSRNIGRVLCITNASGHISKIFKEAERVCSPISPITDTDPVGTYTRLPSEIYQMSALP